MKKVLIITYYWPPLGGSGVQRWLKLSKYLKKYGWQPIIYTPENADFPIKDYSLLADVRNDIEVLKTKINEPYKIFRAVTGKNKSDMLTHGFLASDRKKTLIDDALFWIRGNIFIPDARMMWVKPSVKYLSSYLKQNKVDAIISTGPPHSMHLIALRLKQKLNIKWIADFRDPWLEADYSNELKLSSYSNKRHKALEKKVIITADKVVTVSKSIAKNLHHRYEKEAAIITNGYDTDDFKKKNNSFDYLKFSIHHVGMLNKDRNPLALWSVLKKICETEKEFKNDLQIILTGKTHPLALEALNKNNLQNNIVLHNYVSHTTVTEMMGNSAILLLVLNKTQNNQGIITGKVFEYMAAKRPILPIGNVKSDVAEILKETKLGDVIDFDDVVKLETTILNFYNLYKKKSLFVKSVGIEKYTRESRAEAYSHILNTVVSESK